MTVFELDFFDVGNPMVLGLAEELVEGQVQDCVEYIRKQYGETLPADTMTAIIEEFGIEYHFLPDWLKDKFDEFDVY